MKIYNRFSSELSHEIRDSTPAEIRRFFSENLRESKPELLLHDARKNLDRKRDEYSRMLSLETGNTVLKCREEINASVELIDLAISLFAADPDPEVLHSRARALRKFMVIERSRPLDRILSITSAINPLYRFVENLCAATITSSRTAVRLSSVGAGTVSAFWGDVEAKKDASILPVFALPESRCMRELEKTASKIIFMGENDNYLKIRKKAAATSSSGFLRRKCYALVWEHADLDAAASAISSLALSGMRDPEFTPHRVFVESGSFKYLTNRIVEESLKLRSGDPTSIECEIPCMLSPDHADAFMGAVEDEIKVWGNQLTAPSREGNSVSPAIFSCSETPGKLWNEMKYGPFIITRSAESLAEVVDVINSDKDGGSIILFSGDLNTLKYIENRTSLDFILRDPPGDMSYSDIFRIEDTFRSTMRLMTEKNRTVDWK